MSLSIEFLESETCQSGDLKSFLSMNMESHEVPLRSLVPSSVVAVLFHQVADCKSDKEYVSANMTENGKTNI